jgi:branched-chain amino acid transport system ATP-binding protein
VTGPPSIAAWRPLLVIGVGLVVLPYALLAMGLTLISATDCVLYGLVGLGLNLLLGYTGLVSFGHGAWFGVGAYAAGLIQLRLWPDRFVLPVLLATALVAVAAFVFGALILRRRGVYFSLLTLALTALLFSVAYRWTALTGGESGLGGITRPIVLGVDLGRPGAYYTVVAGLAFATVWFLWSVTGSPFGRVLVAIRENEQRAAFQGYPTSRYKLIAFVISATVPGLAGALLVFNHRFASADPLAVAFSGELVAMVIIGGARSFLGPVLGALFFILFREFLSIWTGYWLLYFGLLFVVFVLFSPTGLVGVARRLRELLRPGPATAAAMAGRVTPAGAAPVPGFLASAAIGDAPVLECRGVVRTFGGIVAVADADLAVRGRGVHALIGPNGAGKTTLFNLVSGLFSPDRGQIAFRGTRIEGRSPHVVARAGLTRSFQITNLFMGLTVAENLRLGVQARHPRRFALLLRADRLADVERETATLIGFLGLGGLEEVPAENLSYGGQRLLDLGIALAGRPALVLLDEPLAGLAAAERDRVGRLVRRLGDAIGVLLVEHDIDRVFEIADRVTVMNQGRILVEGPVDMVRSDPRVHEVYIGSGAAALAARPRAAVTPGAPVLAAEGLNSYYGKSHILTDVTLDLREREVVAVLGRNGAGKSTLLKSLIGLVPPRSGTVRLSGVELARKSPEAIAQAGIGYVPQGRRLFPGLTVADNLGLGRLRRRGTVTDGTHWDDERIFQYFPRIRERLSVAADLLSGGEQQMVAIARALAGDVRLLLLDEPFEGLAPTVIEEVFAAVERLRRDIAVIIVDHNLDLVLALADRVVVLDRGRVVHQGPARPLLEDLDLRRRVLWV